jgi:DNA-binding CsgD family transcriptional regulator
MTAVDCRRLLAASRAAWLRGDGHGTWSALEAAQRLAGPEPSLQAEVLSARAVALLRAERAEESVSAARQCLDLAGRVRQPDVALRRAVAHARVSLATLDPPDASDPDRFAAALAVLDEVAEDRDPELADARSRAIGNALVRRLDDIDPRLGDGRADVQAWIWVGRARVLSEELDDTGTVLRQAVDLAFRTGQWERGWDYAGQHLQQHPGRNEQVALLAKMALLAWERGLDDRARLLGTQAREATVAVDHPWVRTYGYLGGVVAAAAGAGSVSRALRAYARCTTLEGHATRPNRAWLAARVALDVGQDPASLQEFLDRVEPAGLRYPRLSALSRIVLGSAADRDPDPADLEAVELPRLDAADRARVLLATARAKSRQGRRSGAALDLHRARQALAAWPGRLLHRVDEEAATVAVAPDVTPAQRRVLDLLVEGWGNAPIAATLGLSERTVAVHVSALLRATGARSRTELAVQELRRRVVRG